MTKKIPAKALANRLKIVLPDIIDTSQTGGVMGRNIADNTLLLHLLIQFYCKHDMAGFVLSVDGFKAFDQVERDGVWKVMQGNNLPQSFIQQVKVLYMGAKCKLVVNGYLSTEIHFDRGLRQGDPLSSQLYALIAEPLAIRIREEHRIIGMRLPGGKQIKSFQHSDDINFILANKQSIITTIRIFEAYGKFSGAEINYLKSSILHHL